MKVLHVLHSLSQSYGGPVRAVLDLSARAAAHGLDSEILGFGTLDIPDNPFPPECIHVLRRSWPHKYCYSRDLKVWLKSKLRDFDAVVLHGMWLYPNRAIASACVRAGIPYACFPHGMLEPWAVYGQGRWKALKKVIYWRLIERSIFKNARCLYFTTQREMYLAEDVFHLSGMHLLLAPYGVNSDTTNGIEPPNQRILQHPDRKIALFLGRVHPKKNVHFLIEAWHQANLPEPWHLVIAGSSDERYEQELRKLIISYNLTGRVHLVGFVSGADKAYLLRRASWFLLPSKQENFGIAVLEAINHECPVAISDQVFLAESMHRDSEVLPLRLSEWVTFLRERMPNEEWRERLVILDKRHLAQKMHIDNIVKEWAVTLTTSLSRDWLSKEGPGNVPKRSKVN